MIGLDNFYHTGSSTSLLLARECRPYMNHVLVSHRGRWFHRSCLSYMSTICICIRPLQCPSLDVIHYPDDTTALIRGNNLNNLLTTMNHHLNSINTWFQCIRLTLNIQKSSYMVFGPRDVTLNMCINNINLVNVNKTDFFEWLLTESFPLLIIMGRFKLSRVAGITYRLRY